MSSEAISVDWIHERVHDTKLEWCVEQHKISYRRAGGRAVFFERSVQDEGDRTPTCPSRRKKGSFHGIHLSLQSLICKAADHTYRAGGGLEKELQE